LFDIQLWSGSGNFEDLPGVNKTAGQTIGSLQLVHSDAVGLRDGKEGIARLDNISGCTTTVAIRRWGGYVRGGATTATATVIWIHD